MIDLVGDSVILDIKGIDLEQWEEIESFLRKKGVKIFTVWEVSSLKSEEKE